MTAVIPTNPQLFTQQHDHLAQEMINAILQATKSDPQKLIRGPALVLVTRHVLQIVARRGLALLDQGDVAQLGSRLRTCLPLD